MAARLKGNLGLKSSPLAPTSCKLSTQYLVLDHMTNHYNKIAKAKSAIDSKPPKSLSTSQKLRDRKNRDKMMKSPRSRPATSMLQNGLQTYQDYFDDEPEDDEERLVHSIMKSTLLDKGNSSTTILDTNQADMKNFQRDTHVMRPSSARSIQSGHSLGGQSVQGMRMTSTHDPTRITYQGDVLDKRPYLFTEPERPFTPRTLKNNHQSRLKNSKCYNPPPKSRPTRPYSAKSNLAPEVRSAPRPQPRSRAQRHQEEDHTQDQDRPSRRDSFHGLGDTMETTGQLSESMLMDITLRSRDGRHFHQQRHSSQGRANGQEPVPPLAISMDKDHMNWLQEQASKAQARTRGRGQMLTSSMYTEDNSQGEGGTGVQQDHGTVPEAIQKEAMQNMDMYHCRMEWSTPSQTRSLGSCSSGTSWLSQRLMEEDEDQKYLAFAKEVTDDVLSRGICTDSVLHRVFENHIERKKDQLNEDRMRQVIRDLRRDLGLRDSSAERTPHASLRDTNWNNGKVIGPVTVITNGDTSSGDTTQQPSSGSKATTGSTSTKDESSSTFSPANHYRGILGEAGRGKNSLGCTSTSLEPLQVMSSPSENGGLTSSATLESVSSFKFGQTGDLVDTITSEAIQEDTAREREEEQGEDEDEEGDEDRKNGSDELSATQALKQYEFDLTVKEGTAEHSGTTNGTSGREDSEDNNKRRRPQAHKRGKLERPATGERRGEQEVNSEEAKSDSSTLRSAAAPSSGESSHRLRRREEYRLKKTRGVEDLSSQAGSENNSTESTRGQTSGNDKPYATDDEAASVKSAASSQRPSARPRTKLGQNGQKEDKPVPEARSKQGSNSDEKQSKDADYEDDYEDDDDFDEDVDESTHRTSDDDF